MQNEVLLKVKDLVVHYETHNAVVEAVNNVSFEIKSGQTLGLVGETGAGKTTIALAIMSLLPKYTGHIIQGKTAYGCSRWKEGCGFRLPFDEAGNPLDEETLQKRIQDYNPNTHLNHE